MALDPSIALGVRPPQINIDVPSPIQQAATIMSLRDMMTRQQMGQTQLQQANLQLEQAQQMADERRRMAQYFANPQAATSGSLAPAQTLTQPATTSTTPAAGPSSAAITPTATAANQWAFAGGLDPQEFIRRFPLTGPGIVKGYYDSLESSLKASHQNWQTQVDAIDRMSRNAQSIVDEPTKQAAILNSLKDGDITQDQARQLMNVRHDDPSWKSWTNRALDAKEFAANKIAEAKDARESLQFYLAGLPEAISKAGQSQMTTSNMRLAQDAQALAAAFAQGPDVGNAARDALPIDRRAPFMNANTPAQIMRRAMTPEQFLTENRDNLKLLMDAEGNRIKNNADVREQQVHDMMYGEGGNQALYGVEKDLRGQAAKEAQGAGQEYLQANSMADQMQTLLNLARSGNKVAGTNIPVMGAETLNAMNGLRRIPRQQVEAYAGAGNLYDRVVGKIKDLAVGQPIPASVLDDIQTMHNQLRANSENVYDAKLNGINQNYNSHFTKIGRPGQIPQNIQDALKAAGPGDHKGEDGRWWRVGKDGSVQQIAAP